MLKAKENRDVIEAGEDNPIRVETDNSTLEPSPFIGVRGRLEASLARTVFYELVDLAMEDGEVLGVWANEIFFPLGPAGVHDVSS